MRLCYTGLVPIETDPERLRLVEDASRTKNWKRWGPYLADRQWGTVREDYSADGSCWSYFSHDQARSRAYRWGEDGLLGITDRECRLCFGLALWNTKDPILKERLFGLTNHEGNHGEDVKEEYFYLDSTPTHSYLKALYKYPQRAFPYQQLIDTNKRRSLTEPEFELADTGVFDDGRFFDVHAEYAKASPDDILIKLTITNRGPDEAEVHALPTLWFRNTWVWGCTHDGCWPKPYMGMAATHARVGESGGGTRGTGAPAAEVETDHASLGKTRWQLDRASDGSLPTMLFTENHTNASKLFGADNISPHVKDAFHRLVVDGDQSAVNPKQTGSKCAAWYRLKIPAGKSVTIRLRLTPESERTDRPFSPIFDDVFALRQKEADEFYAAGNLVVAGDEERRIARQAYAGLLWSKQFYHYVVADWLDGDPGQPRPPAERSARQARNVDWRHMFARDVIAMPDKWEYPWFAAWDLAFHCVALAGVDPDFAKSQLLLMTREWYMHPSGAIPAYEFAFGDVNPPVHAWACWRVYKLTGADGQRDRQFLVRCFHKLLLNFTWWVNRKDPDGRNVFGGGFLGLDNIGVFDRGAPLPTGGVLEQADATAWMAFYCGTMLKIALELAEKDSAYEDVASKFFEHFVAIIDAMNNTGGSGLWNQEDGFYYDHIRLRDDVDGSLPLRVRSLVGIIPALAVEIAENELIDRMPGFKKRMDWFMAHRPELAVHITQSTTPDTGQPKPHAHRLMAIPSRERLTRMLAYVLDEREFLSPFGIRSLSKVHGAKPFVLDCEGQQHRIEYTPGESVTSVFGGNSNWRGPIWFPINFLFIEALERYHHFYGDTFQIDLPTGSGHKANLHDVAMELRRRLSSVFMPDKAGSRPFHADSGLFRHDASARELVLYHEYFHAETGKGLGANHQTGWTALVAPMLHDLVRGVHDR